MLRLIGKQKWSILVGLLLTIIVTWIQVSRTPLIEKYISRLDLYLYDIRMEALLPDTPDVNPNIFIVDIDERSLQDLGQWPWSRITISRLVDELEAAGVEVAAFDIVFSEPENNSAQLLMDDLSVRQLLSPEKEAELISLRDQVDNDVYLATHLKKMKIVLGYVFHSEDIQKGKLGYPITKIPVKLRDRLTTISRPGYAAALKVLQRGAAEGGFINAVADSDGIIRRMPMMIRHNDGLYPSLSLSAVQQYLGVRRIGPKYQDIGPVTKIDGITLGDRKILTDEHGRMIIDYQGGRGIYPYVSISDLMAGKYRGGGLEGALVFVGTTVLGLSDMRATPLSQAYPGVETHATVAESIIKQQIPYKPAWEVGVIVLFLASLGCLLSMVQPLLRPKWLVATTVLCMAGVVGGNYYLWAVRQFDLTQVTPLLLIFSIFLWNLFNTLVQENRARKAVTSMFGQYVPQQHVQTIMDNPESYQMDGHSRDMSVMFADIRGFTDMSEKLTAAELKMVLNRFFTPITKVIFDHQGTIDKYVGDMVMAFWAAPLDDPDHRQHVVQAAFAMQAAIELLKSEFATEGLPQIDMGIGINSGEMNVGDMGSSYRRSYTVLGDAVNLGSRVESLTKFYGCGLLVTESTKSGAEEYAYRFADCIRVKGKLEPITIFEPLGLRQALDASILTALDNYHAALDLYRQRQWQPALEAFETCRIEAGLHNATLLTIYCDRIVEMQASDPGPDWDGVYTHTSK